MVDNICAPATPYGTSAISVVRCSGPDAIRLVNQIFEGKNLLKVKSHTLHYGYITLQGERIDEVLCSVFLAPHSFDGENTVEINCHGGILITNKVLESLLASGFRLAERGEFSKRAFLNKRLDLTQAEAIMDMISAKNDLALKASLKGLQKNTSRLIQGFRESLLDVIAKIEVNIDYPEYEDSIEVTNAYLLELLPTLLEEMGEILENSKISKLAISGIKAAIIGKPNVGKSSLLNYLLDEDKAIVSDIPGTTRDLVEGSLNVGNITLHLIDTAGIRESEDTIEQIGIERSSKAIQDADLVFLVLDASEELDDTDRHLLTMTKNKNRIIIANKADKPIVWELKDAVYVSSLEKRGLKELTTKLLEVTSIAKLNIDEGRYLANQRQTDLLNKAYHSLQQALEATRVGMDVDLIEIDIRQAFEDLGVITGEATPDELITALFTKFCLGK